METSDDTYRFRLISEKERYRDCVNVHDLPPVFHYWSNRHIVPKVKPFGFADPREMFAGYLQEQHQRRPLEPLRFASIGAGNCELEISLARNLVAQGSSDFVIDCLDLNPAMLERGERSALDASVDCHIRCTETDVNRWQPAHEYNAILANQSLHHVLNLEGLFSQVRNSLKPDGTFVISDMIGRNGHLRWPEALDIVHEFWRKLPPSYRVNQKLRRFEELYENWDCSVEDFEAIRSQDILPLLLSSFHFQLFVGFGNVIDPFVDRAFGGNFDMESPWDRAFIDAVHRRDEAEILAGNIKPTHMLAVVGKNPDIPTRFNGPLSPAFCLRSPGTEVSSPKNLRNAYEWRGNPHETQRELESACQRLASAEDRIRILAGHAASQDKDLADRTAWARGFENELSKRTAWALRLDEEIAESAVRSELLERKLAERTAWALRLDSELTESTQWALQLSRELEEIRNRKSMGFGDRLKTWLISHWQSGRVIRARAAHEKPEL